MGYLRFFSSIQGHFPKEHHQHKILLRLATKLDIPGIDNCNRKTLPENYSLFFYGQNLEKWPSLCFVVEASPNNAEQTPIIVGYVLGRIDVLQNNVRQGHVTSLSVLPAFRQVGIAREMMQYAHEKMIEDYQAETVTLYVRVSNKGALKLYRDTLGYQVSETLKCYYSDGEDAFKMGIGLKSVLPPPPQKRYKNNMKLSDI